MFIKITFSENQFTPHTSDTGDQKEEVEKKQQGQSRHDTGCAALGGLARPDEKVYRKIDPICRRDSLSGTSGKQEHTHTRSTSSREGH